MSTIELNLPFTREEASRVKPGDIAVLSGVVYTARDAAHKRMFALLDDGLPLPFDIKNQTIYYAGPAPAKPGRVIGPCGPTTSSRMDNYAPRLIRLGLTGMIGKGERGDSVRQALRETGSLYFQAVGGAAALIARCVKSAEVIAFEDLGTEAVRRLTIEGLRARVYDPYQ
ncbi:MAG: fumarate hydratase C-terminal domain-containing protein [Oscillospiraceae bacterium]|jgi:fumarate hydratase subunit beta|nr:fumarate hydratase C-terminal domain-containing protein [Oscillospiraceae bacterium]